MDPNAVTEGVRPNVNAINQLNIMDEEWDLGNSPQRDDLKLLCEQNVKRHLFLVLPLLKNACMRRQ